MRQKQTLRYAHPCRTQYFPKKKKDDPCNNKQRPQTVTAHGLLNTSLYLQTVFPMLKQFTELMAQ